MHKELLLFIYFLMHFFKWYYDKLKKKSSKNHRALAQLSFKDLLGPHLFPIHKQLVFYIQKGSEAWSSTGYNGSTAVVQLSAVGRAGLLKYFISPFVVKV